MRCFHLFHLRGRLPERGVVVAALDALERKTRGLRHGPGVDVALLTGWYYGCGLDGRGFGGRDVPGRRVGLAQYVLEVDGLGVLRAQLQRLGNGRERVAHIAAARQRNGEVELVVRVLRIAVDGFLKERSAIVASTRCRYSLVVDYFG